MQEEEPGGQHARGGMNEQESQRDRGRESRQPGRPGTWPRTGHLRQPVCGGEAPEEDPMRLQKQSL